MAIAFARARYVSRSSGGNAVRSAAYNARAEIAAPATKQTFYFRHRGDLEHHEVLLPNGADGILSESAILWNAAEAAEKRKDAQVARELVLALPMDVGVTLEDQVELARGFAIEHFVSKGVAVQLDVHAPHVNPGEEQSAGEGANWHAHLLVTTRRVDGVGFEDRKARDLSPEVRSVSKRKIVSEGDLWGELWRTHQDRWFVEHGLVVRVDATAAVPGEHLGPKRMRGVGSRAAARAEELRTANEVAARDPAAVLAALTRNSATFIERDLERYVLKHLPEKDRVAATVAVLTHPDLLALHDRDTGTAVGRFTTTTVRSQEQMALVDAAAVLGSGHHRGVISAAQAAALAERTLRPEQQEAFEHAAGAGGLKVIEGRAGTGKSYTLGAVRDAHQQAGYRVVGLAPTNVVAQDMGRDGFGETGTVHSALFALKNGRTAWDSRTVLVVDEAAMLDSRVTGELLAAARVSGAKVVLAGDDRQLASVERGGLFTALRERYGSAVLQQVDRQQVPWQREAAQDLAEGRFTQAVRAFDRHGAVTWTADDGANLVALVKRWQADTVADPQSTRFVFAYTNAEVDALNAGLRAVLRARGALGPDVRLDTQHGAASFAVGDRVQFTATAKRLGLFNGNAGTITALDAATGRVTARLDSGRAVAWQVAEFDGFRHGYAGTIYKGQGKTLDHTYLLHGKHWRAASSYVALTRQRLGAQVFVSRQVAQNVGQLARQMARGEVRAASVAWATAAEAAVSPRQVAEAAAARAEAMRAAAAQGVRVAAEQAERCRVAGQAPMSLRRVLEGRRAVWASSSLPDLVPRLAGLKRTLVALPDRVALAVQQRMARLEVIAEMRRAAEAVAARAGAVRAAAAQGLQAWRKLDDQNFLSFRDPGSLRRTVAQRRTARTVNASVPDLVPRLARLGRSMVALPGQIAETVQQHAAETPSLEAQRTKLVEAARARWWSEQEANPLLRRDLKLRMPREMASALQWQVDRMPAHEVREGYQALQYQQAAARADWVTGVRAQVLQDRTPASTPPAEEKRLKMEVLDLPHEALLAFATERAKTLLLREGLRTFQPTSGSRMSPEALKAARAEEESRLRTRIDEIPSAELLQFGEVRRRQAERAEQVERARPAASARSQPSSGPSM